MKTLVVIGLKAPIVSLNSLKDPWMVSSTIFGHFQIVYFLPFVTVNLVFTKSKKKRICVKCLKISDEPIYRFFVVKRDNWGSTTVNKKHCQLSICKKNCLIEKSVQWSFLKKSEITPNLNFQREFGSKEVVHPIELQHIDLS